MMEIQPIQSPVSLTQAMVMTPIAPIGTEAAGSVQEASPASFKDLMKKAVGDLNASQVEGSNVAICPGVRTIPAPMVLPIATAIPKPTPSVLIRRPRPECGDSAEVSFVANCLASPSVTTKGHHSRAASRRKWKLPGVFCPQRHPTSTSAQRGFKV